MTGPTLVEAWKAATDHLRAAGVEEPTVDARLLVEAGGDVKRADILIDPRRELTLEQTQRIAALVLRRAAREPISQIFGLRGFRTIALVVTRDVLTPRPETELVVELGLRGTSEDAPLRVLDLGVGSGAILAAVLTERPNAAGLGIDASEAALRVAQNNLDRLGLSDRAKLRLGDWGAGIQERFDLVLANPPYVAAHEMAALPPEVAHYEPHLALRGGEDGLDAYRVLIRQLPDLLVDGGRAVLEFGPTQSDAVQALAEQAGLAPIELARDLARRPRVWVLEKPLGVPA